MTHCRLSSRANKLLLLKLACLGLFLQPSCSFAFQTLPRASLVSQVRQLHLSSRDDNNIISQDISALEKEVWSSTQARLDMQRVSSLLDDDFVKPGEDPYSPFKVALSAGGVSSLLSFALFHNLGFSGLVLISVFFIANGDPLEEDSVAGALARVVGRATLESVEASQPKVRAVARAAVRGDEQYIELKAKLDELEEENKSLRLWKERRILVDANLNKFPFDDLKDRARSAGLMVGGTKAQLLMRLVEANEIKLSDISYNNQNAYSASFDQGEFLETNPQTSLANQNGPSTGPTSYPPNFYRNNGMP